MPDYGSPPKEHAEQRDRQEQYRPERDLASCVPEQRLDATPGPRVIHELAYASGPEKAS